MESNLFDLNDNSNAVLVLRHNADHGGANLGVFKGNILEQNNVIVVKPFALEGGEGVPTEEVVVAGAEAAKGLDIVKNIF